MTTSKATAGKGGPNQRKGGTAIGVGNAGGNMNHHRYVTQGEMKSMMLELLKRDKESMRGEIDELKGGVNFLEEKLNVLQKSKEETSDIEIDEYQLPEANHSSQASSSAAKKKKNRHNKNKKKGNNKHTPNYWGGDNVGSLTKVTAWASTWKIGVGFISIAVLGSIAFGQGIVGQSYPFVWGRKGGPPAKKGGYAPTNVDEAVSWEEELLVIESIDKGVLEKEEAKAVVVVKNEAADRNVRRAVKEDQTQEEKSSDLSKNAPNLNLMAGFAGRRLEGDSSMRVSADVASNSFDEKPPPSLQKHDLGESVTPGKLEKTPNLSETSKIGASSKSDHTAHATKTHGDVSAEVKESPPSLRKRKGRYTSGRREILRKAARPSKTMIVEEGVMPAKVHLSDEVGGVASRTLQGNVSPAAMTIDEEDSSPTATAIEEDDSSLETSNLFGSSVTPASPSSTLLPENNDVATIIPTSSALFAPIYLPTMSESNTAFNAGIVFTPDYVCDANPKECGCPNLRGLDYRGPISETKDGRECVNWDAWGIEKYPDAGIEENFCRNPGLEPGGPWCWTEEDEDGYDWGYCDVPVCAAVTAAPTTSSIPTSSTRPTGSPSSSSLPSSSSSPTQICPVADNELCGCANIGQADYRGTKSSTKEGFDCVRWDSDWVKSFGWIILEDYPDAGLESNFCRNPDNDMMGPWCYAHFPDADGEYYQYCDIPSCDPHLCMPPCGEPNDSAHACPSVFQANRCCDKEYASANCECAYFKDACGISLENNTTDFCDDAEAACCEVGGEDTRNQNCKCNMYEQICSENPSQSTCDQAADSCCEFLDWDSQCFCDFYTYTENVLNEKSEFKSSNCFEAEQIQVNTLSNEEGLLKSLYKNTGGDYWTTSSGWLNETIPHCEWFGLKCNEDGHIIEIDLRKNNLSGVDFFEPLDFLQLVNLDVAGNKLSGKVGSTGILEYHRRLVHIDISDNHFSGEVDMSFPPSTLHVNYSHNNITSAVFKRFNPSYETLRFVDLSNNGITQDASSLFVNIPPHIQELSLSNNGIQGTLPDPFPLENVKTFTIADNALNGALPNFPSPQLEKLDLSKQNKRENGGLSGAIPTALSNLGKLTELNLAGNKLTSGIPSILGNLQYLKVLDVSSNALAGPIPSELGKLADVLHVLDLSSNELTGSIPLQLANLESALVELLLRGNANLSTPAPLDLCYLPSFDLVNDSRFCPLERNTLKDFYISAKGGEWTESKDWLDPFLSHCNWTGVRCEIEEGHVIKLELPHNGLSGKLTKDISKLTSLEVLDLSDNDMKGGIPSEIGLLSSLTKLILRYNNFVGNMTDLRKLQNLEVVHLHGNRLSGTILSLDTSFWYSSSSVSDCGYPSDFDKSLECDSCTMCCNSQGDCYPTKKTLLNKAGFENYTEFTFAFFACLIVIFGGLVSMLYACNKYHQPNLQGSSIGQTVNTESDTTYALKTVGNDSVYQVCLGERWPGRIILLLTLAAQLMLLFVFVGSAEIDWKKETSALVYTWKCPRDEDECKNTTDLKPLGWFGFAILMIAFLLKDIVKGIRLIVFSAKQRHSSQRRVKYFLGGMLLITMSAFALYVSIIYNAATATDNKEVIENAVIILFVNDIDEKLYDLLMVVNEDWVKEMMSQEEDTSDDEEDGVERESQVQSSQILSRVDQSEVIQTLKHRVEALETTVDKLYLQLNDFLTLSQDFSSF